MQLTPAQTDAARALADTFKPATIGVPSFGESHAMLRQRALELALQHASARDADRFARFLIEGASLA